VRPTILADTRQQQSEIPRRHSSSCAQPWHIGLKRTVRCSDTKRIASGYSGAARKSHIKRVPIAANQRVVGIVSRANLIQALASLRREIEPSTITDAMIRKRLMAQFRSEQWSKHSILNATVQGGTVNLWDIVDSEAEKEAARVAAEQVAAIQAIENNVIVQPVQA
jgi:BON domain